MANKFRGTTWNNARFGPKIQIRRSIDLAELGDFGEITENSSDLPTAGAAHRSGTKGSTSATRGYTDLQGLFDTVVDNQDMGVISDAITTHRIWSSTGAITDIVTSAPTGILPGSGSTSSGASWTKTWELTDWAVNERIENTQSLNSGFGTGNYIAGQNPYADSKISWSDDGYFVYATSSAHWLQREVSTPYDIKIESMVEEKRVELNAAGSPSSPASNHIMRRNMRPINNGNKTVSWGMHTTGGKGILYIDDLVDQWDITSVQYTTTNTYDLNDDVSTGYVFPVDVQFNSDGTAMYALFTLGRQWDTTTSKFTDLNSPSAKSSIVKWTLSTAWDLSTASTTSTSFYNFSSPGMDPSVGFALNPDETEFYAIINENSYTLYIERHEIPTAGDLSSMTPYPATNQVYRRLLNSTVGQSIQQSSITSDGKVLLLGNYYVVDLETDSRT